MLWESDLKERASRFGRGFQRKDDPGAFRLAGLWDFARLGDAEILSAAIIVGESNPLAAAVHDRMPVILEPDDYDRWLDPDIDVEELRSLLRPFPAERMRAEAVSRSVNRVKNDNEECIVRFSEPPLTPDRP